MQLVPGDEDSCYQLNPGEGFAEDYRVLNERRAGIPESPWQVVDDSLYPDQAALDLLAQDVTSPWTGDTETSYRSMLGPRASGRGFRLATALDGNFTATLSTALEAAGDATDRRSELRARCSRPIRRPLQTKTLGVTVCGQRTLQVQVRRVSGSGAFTLTLDQP